MSRFLRGRSQKREKCEQHLASLTGDADGGLPLDSRGRRARLHEALAKLVGAGRSGVAAAAALADAAAYIAVRDNGAYDTSPDDLVLQSGKAMLRAGTRSATAKATTRSPDLSCYSASPSKTNSASTSAASLQREASLRRAFGDASDVFSMSASTLGASGAADAGAQDNRSPAAAKMQLASTRNVPEESVLSIVPSMAELDLGHNEMLVPPMKKWLKQKIGKTDRGEAPHQSAPSKTKADRKAKYKPAPSPYELPLPKAQAEKAHAKSTVAEVYNEGHIRRGFTQVILRGSLDAEFDSQQKERVDQMRDRQRKKKEFLKEHRDQVTQRQTQSQQPQLLEKENLEVISEDQGSNSATSSAVMGELSPRRHSRGPMNLPKPVSKTGSEEASLQLPGRARGSMFFSLVKPKHSLTVRLQMLERLGQHRREAETDPLSPGSPLNKKDWNTMRVLAGVSGSKDKQKQKELANAMSMLSPSELMQMRQTYNRYDYTQQDKLKAAELRQALKDIGLFPRATDEKQAVASLLDETDADKFGQSFDEFVLLSYRMRDVLMDVQRPQLEFLFYQACDAKQGFKKESLPEMFKIFGITVEKGSPQMDEVNSHFASFGSDSKVESKTDAMDLSRAQQEFEVFHVTFQKMQEKLQAQGRTAERKIAEEMGISDALLNEFRAEIGALQRQYLYYDKNQNGTLEESEVLCVLGDFGIMPKTKYQRARVEQLISDAKRAAIRGGGRRSSAERMTVTAGTSPGLAALAENEAMLEGKMSPRSLQRSSLPPARTSTVNKLMDAAGRAKEPVHFNFSEFLLLIKRVRRMNDDALDTELATIFNRYDQDHSGELDMKEVSILLADLGLQPRNQQEQDVIMEILQECDEDGSNTFSLDEFKVLVSRIKERSEKSFRNAQKLYAELLGHDESQYKGLLSRFQELDDLNQGSLGPDATKMLLLRCKRQQYDDRAFRAIFNQIDVQGTGFITFTDFLGLIKLLDTGQLPPAFDYHLTTVTGSPNRIGRSFSKSSA